MLILAGFCNLIGLNRKTGVSQKIDFKIINLMEPSIPNSSHDILQQADAEESKKQLASCDPLLE